MDNAVPVYRFLYAITIHIFRSDDIRKLIVKSLRKIRMQYATLHDVNTTNSDVTADSSEHSNGPTPMYSLVKLTPEIFRKQLQKYTCSLILGCLLEKLTQYDDKMTLFPDD